MGQANWTNVVMSFAVSTIGNVVRVARPFAAAVATALVTAVLMPLGHGGTASAQSPTKVDFAGSVTWLGQVPIMVAVDKGFFKEQGLDVGYQVILTSSDRMAALTAGSVAFSNLGRGAVISQMARGNNTFYFFANIDQAPGNEGCYARPGIASLADLKGKKVAANTSAEVTLDGLLVSAGMSKKDIQYLDLPPNEMVGAISKGDVDAVCVWQPFLGNAQKAVPNGKIVGTDMDTANYKNFKTVASADIMIISRKLVDEHPEVARKLATAIYKGVEFTNKNPEDAAKTVAHYFKQSPEEVLAGMKTFEYPGLAGWPDHFKRQVAQMQDFAKYLYDTKKIPVLPDVQKWANTSFIPNP